MKIMTDTISYNRTVKLFFVVNESTDRICVYSNSPVDDIKVAHPKIDTVTHLDPALNDPYIAKFYCYPYSEDEIVDYLTTKLGFEQVPAHNPEVNGFRMQQSGDRAGFYCTSTGDFSGVPDVPGFEGDAVMLPSDPAQWGFSVPTGQADYVRDRLIAYKWKEY
jgi:hypothetical protein